MDAYGPRGVFGLTVVFLFITTVVAITSTQLMIPVLLQSTAGSLQSLCWASSAVGGIASAYFSGALVDAYGPRGVFGLTAVFPLMVSLSAVFISEQPVIGNSNRQKRGSEDEEDKAESGVHCTH